MDNNVCIVLTSRPSHLTTMCGCGDTFTIKHTNTSISLTKQVVRYIFIVLTHGSTHTRRGRKWSYILSYTHINISLVWGSRKKTRSVRTHCILTCLFPASFHYASTSFCCMCFQCWHPCTAAAMFVAVAVDEPWSWRVSPSEGGCFAHG